jgi:uncharacterized protein (TIGR02594 family)
MRIETSAFEIAQRFVGMKEVPGKQDNPLILAMLKLDGTWPDHDEVPWCSAFLNFVCWLLRLPRSKSLRARSWLEVGRLVPIEEARVGFDVVILQRGTGDQPGPEVIDAPGHVGLFAGLTNGDVLLLGGNQGDKVCVSHYPQSRVLGVRRLVA